MGNITKWLLLIFGAMVILLNAAETALFGATYLPAAFGNPDNGISALLAAGYVLLMLDGGYIVWFKVWLSGEQATKQRDVAIALSALSLIGSIMATVTQLATNTSLAPYLIPYRDTIGTIAFFVVLAVTVAHIVGLAVYKYSEPEQQIATKTAKIQGKVIDDALKELETRANGDKDILVDILATEFRVNMLNALGFSQQLKRIGKQPALLPDSNEDDPDFDLDAMVDYLANEKANQQKTSHTPYKAHTPNEKDYVERLRDMPQEEFNEKINKGIEWLGEMVDKTNQSTRLTAEKVVAYIRNVLPDEYEAYKQAALLLLGGATPESVVAELANQYADNRLEALTIVYKVQDMIERIKHDEAMSEDLDAAKKRYQDANFTQRSNGR